MWHGVIERGGWGVAWCDRARGWGVAWCDRARGVGCGMV